MLELITQKNLHPQGVSQEIITQLNELKQRVVNEQIRFKNFWQELHYLCLGQDLGRDAALWFFIRRICQNQWLNILWYV